MYSVSINILLCLSGQEMAPTGQTSLLKDSWQQNSILWAEQLVDPKIVYITRRSHSIMVRASAL